MQAGPLPPPRRAGPRPADLRAGRFLREERPQGDAVPRAAVLLHAPAVEEVPRHGRTVASATAPVDRCDDALVLSRTATLGPELPDALRRLRDDLVALRLQLELPDSSRARAARDDIVGQTDDYLLPRLERMDAPVLMVVGGSTGAGKSTIVNSLVGAEVSPSGVLRPTTRGPVLVCHPDDVRWFEDDRILPGLPRVTGGAPTPGTLLVVPVPTLEPGLALLDSPDIDSVLAENRALATQLLAAADAWLFVTTAARYADAVPWEFLATARERGTALSIVLNRVPDDAEREVTAHLGEMMRGGADRRRAARRRGDTARRRSPAARPSSRRCAAGSTLSPRTRRRGRDLIRRTLTGALRSLPGRAGAVERAAAEQLAAAADLRAAGGSRVRVCTAGCRGCASQRLASSRRGRRPLARGGRHR